MKFDDTEKKQLIEMKLQFIPMFSRHLKLPELKAAFSPAEPPSGSPCRRMSSELEAMVGISGAANMEPFGSLEGNRKI